MASPLGSITPTMQVPQPNDGLLSRHDIILLLARDAPLARATPQAQQAALQWAQKANAVATTVASAAAQATTQFDNFFCTLLPHDSDDVVLKGSVIIQKKILALDMEDLVADTGDDLENENWSLLRGVIVAVTKQVAVSDEVPVLPWVATADMLSPTNFRFNLDFHVSKDFGIPGAIIVKNRHVSEFLLVSFAIQMPDSSVINFPADSWVYNTNFKCGRIFFSNELYLPSATPDGLVVLRDQELQNLRGDGQGERSYQDRIYDYATYNDLGDADQDESLTRPVLGGSQELPYPRRIRTGRPPSTKDPQSESRGNVLTIFYIPRDERFDQVKFSDFAADAVRGGSHKIIPTLKTAAGYGDDEFNSFADIKSLYVATDSRVTAPLSNLKPEGPVGDEVASLWNQNPLTFVHEYAFPSGSDTDHITYPLESLIWCVHLQEFPIQSKLDPLQFGDPLSGMHVRAANAAVLDERQHPDSSRNRAHVAPAGRRRREAEPRFHSPSRWRHQRLALGACQSARLLVRFFPYAADGLELWTAMKEYMTDHVGIFYETDEVVQEDGELQAWWTEVRTVGHGDKSDAPGWPTLDSVESLVYTLTTIAWVASCHHAAVNFGQYAYAGYMPNKPSMTRKLIPEPGTADWDQLQLNPERFFLDSIANESQATSVMATIEILSMHAIDEEYLGQRVTPNWSNDPRVLAAFAKFSAKMNDVENLINLRNADPSLKNRSGPVQLPYELLLPTSTPGLTGKGVPNSISI